MMHLMLFALTVLGSSSLRIGLITDASEKSRRTPPKELAEKKTALFCPCGKNCGYGTALMCQAGAFAITRHFPQQLCFVIHAENVVSADDLHFDGLKFSGLHTDAGCEQQEERAMDRGRYGQGIDRTKLDEYYTMKVREELRAQYDSTPKPQRDPWCEVVVHVRRGDVQRDYKGPQCLHNPDGLQDDQCRWESITVAQKAIERYFPNKKICVFSQGDAQNYAVLTNITDSRGQKRVKLILETEGAGGSFAYAFHQMASAPELLIAHSHFSYAAAVFNPKGQIYHTPHSILTPLKGWIELKGLESFQDDATYVKSTEPGTKEWSSHFESGDDLA